MILSGPAGTGKTLSCLWKMKQCAENTPGFRGAIVRRTRVSLTTTGLVTFERDVLGLDHPLVIHGPRRGSRNTYRFPRGGDIEVLGLDHPSKLLSGDFDLIHVVQAEELEEDSWETLLTRLRNHVLPFQQVTGDCNPGNPKHWIKLR